jgi:ATP-dependent Clp protease adaptor protein ClpS
MSTDTEIIIDEKIKQTVKEPPKYKVIFLNDDQTPMEWVMDVLQMYFKHSRETAENIMLTIHQEGSGVAGIYSYEIAEIKATEATNASRERGFPLQIRVEAE